MNRWETLSGKSIYFSLDILQNYDAFNDLLVHSPPLNASFYMFFLCVPGVWYCLSTGNRQV